MFQSVCKRVAVCEKAARLFWAGLAAVALCCCFALSGCASQDASSGDAAAAQAATYEATVPEDVAEQVAARMMQGEAAPVEGWGVLADFDVAVDDQGRRVTIQAEVQFGTSLEAACEAGEGLAYLVSACSSVTCDGQPVAEGSFGETPGALYRAYEVQLFVDDAEGTLDLDGLKPLDHETIVWQ